MLKVFKCLACSLFFAAYASVALSEDYSVAIAKAELAAAAEQYSSCNSACATDLASQIFDESTKVVLATFGAMKTQDSQAPKQVKAIAWYKFIQLVYQSGAVTIGEHAACSQRCDALHSDIVKLGRAGLLGPMLRSENIDADALVNSEMFELYLKYIEPIPLPAEHRGEEWWKFISSTG